MADGSQLMADGSQLMTDGSQLMADGSQLMADGSQLMADGSQLMADGSQLMADGSQLVENDAQPLAEDSPTCEPQLLAANARGKGAVKGGVKGGGKGGVKGAKKAGKKGGVEGGVNGGVNGSAGAGAAGGGQARLAIGYTSAMDETIVRLRAEGAVWRVVGQAVGRGEKAVQRRWALLQKMEGGSGGGSGGAGRGQEAAAGAAGRSGASDGREVGSGSASGGGGEVGSAAARGVCERRAAAGDYEAWLSASDVSDGGGDEAEAGRADGTGRADDNGRAGASGGASQPRRADATGLADGAGRAGGNGGSGAAARAGGGGRDAGSAFHQSRPAGSSPTPDAFSWRVPAGPRWNALPSFAFCGGGSLLREGGPLEPGAEIPEGGADLRPGLWDASAAAIRLSSGRGGALPAGLGAAARLGSAAGVGVAAAPATHPHAWHDTPSGVWERVVHRWREFRRQADAAYARPAAGGENSTGDGGSERSGRNGAIAASGRRGAACASAQQGDQSGATQNRPGSPNRPRSMNRPGSPNTSRVSNGPGSPNRPGAPSVPDASWPLSVWDVIDETCFASAAELGAEHGQGFAQGEGGYGEGSQGEGSRGNRGACDEDACRVVSLAEDEAYEMPRPEKRKRAGAVRGLQAVGARGGEVELRRAPTPELNGAKSQSEGEGGELVRHACELDSGHGGDSIPSASFADAPRLAPALTLNSALQHAFEAHASSTPASLWGGAYSGPAARKGAVWLALQSLVDLVPAAPTAQTAAAAVPGPAEAAPVSGLYRVIPHSGIRAGQLFLAEVAGVRLALVAPEGWRGGSIGLRLPHLGSGAAQMGTGGVGTALGTEPRTQSARQPRTELGTESGTNSGIEPGTETWTPSPAPHGRMTPADVPTVTATPIALEASTATAAAGSPNASNSPSGRAADAAEWAFVLETALERGSVVMADLPYTSTRLGRVAVLLPHPAKAGERLLLRRESNPPPVPPAAALPPPVPARCAVHAGQARLAVSVNGASEHARALMVQMPAESSPATGAGSADPPLAAVVLPPDALGGTYLCAPTWLVPAHAGAAGAASGGVGGVPSALSGGSGGAGAAGEGDGTAGVEGGATPLNPTDGVGSLPRSLGTSTCGVGSLVVGGGGGATSFAGIGVNGKFGERSEIGGGSGGLTCHPALLERFAADVPPEAPPGASVLAATPDGRMVQFRLPSQLPAHRRVTVRIQPTDGAVWRGEVGEACVTVPVATGAA
jgi:hypothetical protein